MALLHNLPFFLFVFFAFVNSCYYIYLGNFAFSKARPIPIVEGLPPVSVLVCAKNEYENITKNIPHLLQQEYPRFELILINDGSVDDSLRVMHAFAKADTRIQVVDVVGNDRFWGSKKYALTLGIKRARHKHLLFMDADCRPVSRHWIEGMASYFTETKQLVLGYGGYGQIKGNWLNKTIRFETLLTALQYFGYAKNKNPYMGVGRNLGYTAELFYENKGFTNHINVPSGDDDLFVNAAATAINTAFAENPKTFTLSPPKTTWGSWIDQKRRHTSVAHLYRPKHRFQLGLFYVSQILFFALLVANLALGNFLLWVAITFILRLLISYSVVIAAAKKLGEDGLAIWIPILELFLIPMQLVIFSMNLFAPPRRWN